MEDFRLSEWMSWIGRILGVVFQGTDGAYSQAAMHKVLFKDVNSFHVQTFRDAMEAIEEGSADFAVLPIENSSAGMVSEMYDLLENLKLYRR